MTTTTPRKVAKPLTQRPAPSQKPKRFSFNRELAAEMLTLTDKTWDPAYLGNLVTGVKRNKTLDEGGTLRQALANLAARGIVPAS
jgi:hypothetical protein